MNTIRTRNTMLVAAIAAALSLTACDSRTDTSATPRTDRSAATTTSPGSTSPSTTDKMTADSSTAAARAGSDASRSSTTANDATRSGTTANDASARAGTAADKAATAAGDAALTAKVKAALMAEPGIDSLAIDVDTTNSRVTLSGNVDTPQHRQRALQVARGVEGVNGVVDRLSAQR